MKLIVGLGNPGKKYEGTRHNVGFLALDQIMQKLRYSDIKILKNDENTGNKKYPNIPISQYPDFKLENRFKSETVKVKIGEQEAILVKPQTFMNLSGEAVKKIIDFYKMNPESDLIVLHDDIDIELGKIRVKNRGSSAGHNGVQSIIDNIGTDQFIRFRIGIGRPDSCPIGIDEYVLGEMSKEEKESVLGAINAVINSINSI